MIINSIKLGENNNLRKTVNKAMVVILLGEMLK
jgi:hypothetical protein